MNRRALLLALPQLLAQRAAGDVWDELAQAWNPFANKMNTGVIDLNLWRKVVTVVDRIEGTEKHKGR